MVSSPLTRIVRPTSDGSPPNRLSQMRWLRIGGARPAAAHLFGEEAATVERAHRGAGERVAPDERGEHALGTIAARDVAVAEVECRDVLERVEAADVEVLRGRERLDEALLAVDARERDGHHEEAIGIRETGTGAAPGRRRARR